jgi:hypothetical protein
MSSIGDIFYPPVMFWYEATKMSHKKGTEHKHISTISLFSFFFLFFTTARAEPSRAGHMGSELNQ